MNIKLLDEVRTKHNLSITVSEFDIVNGVKYVGGYRSGDRTKIWIPVSELI